MDDGCMTLLKQRYIPIRLQGIISQNTVIFMLYVVNLVWNTLLALVGNYGQVAWGGEQLRVAV